MFVLYGCPAAIVAGVMIASAADSDTAGADSVGTVPELEKMVVAADRRHSSYAVSTKSLTAGEFAGRHSDLAGVLNTLCGVTIHRTGGLGAYSDMSIRGSGSNQVQIYLDGLPLNSATGGAVDLSKIPLNQIRTVTMYSSTAPLELSGLNAGGVIELTTEPGAEKDLVSGVVEAGSYGYTKGGALLGTTGERLSHRLSVDYAHSDNDYPYVYDPTRYQKGDESVKHKDNHHFTSINALYANTLELPSGGHSLKSQLSIGGNRNGLFNYDTPDSNDGYSRDRNVTLTEQYTATVSNKLSLRVNLSARHKENIFQRTRPYYIGTTRKRRTVYPYAGGWTTGVLTFNERFLLKGLVGGRYEGYHEYDMWSDTQDGAHPYARRMAARAGLEAEYNTADMLFARCKATAVYEIDSTNGISFQHGHTAVNPRATSERFASAQAEVRVELPHAVDLSLSGVYGRRSPSLSEKFARGNRLYGNEDLVPETRMEAELGVSYRHERGFTSVAAYYGATLNKIKWVARSQNVFVPENIETVNGRGVEWDLTLDPWKWVSVSNAFGLMYNIIDSDQAGWDGNFEPLLPVLKERCEVRLFLAWITLGHSLLYSSPYYLGAENSAYIDPGMNLGLHVSAKWLDNVEFTYRLDNYLDRVGYAAEGYEYLERLPKPGRMHYGVIRLTL